MQRWILKRKNPITLINAILIVVGFIAELGFHQETVTIVAFGLASILGFAPIAIQAVQALKVKVVSIDLLVTIAVLGAVVIRNLEESAIVTFLFLFGAYLEQRTLMKTRQAIKELTDLAPLTALKRQDDGSFEEVDVEDVDVNDVVLVKTGAQVPVDGTILSGSGSLNESSITGESLPVDKGIGQMVYAGTILENGTLQVTADRIGEDTTFGKIIELVEEAQDSKSAAERFIDRFAKYYTPIVLILGIVVYLFTQDIELAITILVLGCPGALVIGVPVSNVAGIGNGARHGILLKGSEVIRDFSRLDTMIFDKTGTLTIGKPEVAEEIDLSDDPKQARTYLAAIERESDHPLAKAIVRYLGDTPTVEVTDTKVIQGKGIIAMIGSSRVLVGKPALIQDEGIVITKQARQAIDRLEKEGNSLVVTAIDDKLSLILGIKDQLRPGVKDDLKKLKKLGVKHLVLLSGDHQATVDRIAKDLGLDQAFGDKLPHQKAEFVKKLIDQGQRVAFVGDGVNDSPSLALAQIGIAMGSGTDVAIETSNVVLMNSDFSKLPHALGLVKATSRNMIQNIVIAIGVVLLLLVGVLTSDWMTMSIGMFVHEASILVVILNGMRLLRYR